MNHLMNAVFGIGSSNRVGTSLSHQVCKSASNVRVSARVISPIQRNRVSTLTHTHVALSSVPDDR